MSNNPHYGDALDNIMGAEEVTGHEPEDRAIFALTAQAQATLALAFEQRTANLIDSVFALPLSAPDAASLRDLIKERLGLW